MEIVAKIPLEIPVGGVIEFRETKIVCKRSENEECKCRDYCYFDGIDMCKYLACFPENRSDENVVYFEPLKDEDVIDIAQNKSLTKNDFDARCAVYRKIRADAKNVRELIDRINDFRSGNW